MPGRPRKPIEIKKLEGTYRKDRDWTSEMPTFDPVLAADPAPEFFDEYEMQEYEFLTRTLIRNNVLKDIDMNLVIMYCLEMGKYMRYSQFCKENGISFMSANGNVRTRPEVSAMNDALMNVLRIATKLGISPTDRSRLKIDNKQLPEDDPVMKFI